MSNALASMIYASASVGVEGSERMRISASHHATGDGKDPLPSSHTRTNPVKVSNNDALSLPDLSSLSTADIYTNLMKDTRIGYALLNPLPFSDHSEEYLRNGVNIGDVGFVTEDGTFDFLFNICLSQSRLNPPDLPDGFTFENEDERVMSYVNNDSATVCSTVEKKPSDESTTEKAYYGAVLDLPGGVIEYEVENREPFLHLAMCRAIDWYKYTMSRGKNIDNGSLYLVTSFTKSSQLAIAVFDANQCLKFVTSPLYKKDSNGTIIKVNPNHIPNMCTTLRGYRIKLRQDIFDELYNQVPRSESAMSSGRRQPAHIRRLDEVYFSDACNAKLLNEFPEAKIALVHDNSWGHLRKDLSNSKREKFIDEFNDKFRSYLKCFDEFGCVTIDRPFAVKNSTNAVGAKHIPEDNIVTVTNLVPVDPSSSPVPSIADKYTRSMLDRGIDYPLYEPQPFGELSTEYLRKGINIGDVGWIRTNGTFDFLFNICPPKDGFINPPKLPSNFILKTTEEPMTKPRKFLAKAHFCSGSVTRKASLFGKGAEYTCEKPDGAVLELPNGAIKHEVLNSLPFATHAASHGVEWYKYAMNRGRDIKNGSLCLVTSVTKCTDWGIAFFYYPGQSVRFVKKGALPDNSTEYCWKGSGDVLTKVSTPNKWGFHHCVSLQGFKIQIREDVFDDLRKDYLCHEVAKMIRRAAPVA